ncbi:MAG TPA: hypothetical protein VK855_10745 [Thioalkalivibrio sp.]|nr:hypothetical protein [Thioalkalivibrio sp.]
MARTHAWCASALLGTLFFSLSVYAWDPSPVSQDPLVRMPGTQPGQVSLEGPNRCTNCHEGYHQAVEPGFNWKGNSRFYAKIEATTGQRREAKPRGRPRVQRGDSLGNDGGQGELGM